MSHPAKKHFLISTFPYLNTIWRTNSLFFHISDQSAMPEACIVEGQELYLHFLHEQVRNAGLSNFDSSLEDDLK